MLGLINCDETKKFFGKRTIFHDLRQAREVVEHNTNRNYIYDSSSFRLRRKWNKIVIPNSKLQTNNLSVLKKELKAVVNRYN